MSLQFKRDEITDYARTMVEDIHDCNPDKLNDVHELHNEIFNSDYYIIGRYQAKQWMGSNAFDCIGAIQDYEMNHFGEAFTDLSEPERVVNMYVYIVGEQVLEDVISEFKSDQLELEYEGE